MCVNYFGDHNLWWSWLQCCNDLSCATKKKSDIYSEPFHTVLWIENFIMKILLFQIQSFIWWWGLPKRTNKENRHSHDHSYIYSVPIYCFLFFFCYCLFLFFSFSYLFFLFFCLLVCFFFKQSYILTMEVSIWANLYWNDSTKIPNLLWFTIYNHH